MTPAEVCFDVAGVPPAKNEALSLFSEKHGQRERVVALLAAAQNALPADFRPFGRSLTLEVVVRRPEGTPLPDATNLLGGIGDVLEDKSARRLPPWIAEFATTVVFRNDRQIRQIVYREEPSTVIGYRVRISSAASDPSRRSAPSVA